ncbi:hypothetical protein TNCV_491341 [Trichonephila clavipes]|nr:hypothetical protein TNCV_491341 [Trichonephila clavipes]
MIEVACSMEKTEVPSVIKFIHLKGYRKAEAHLICRSSMSPPLAWCGSLEREVPYQFMEVIYYGIARAIRPKKNYPNDHNKTVLRYNSVDKVPQRTACAKGISTLDSTIPDFFQKHIQRDSES